MAPPLASAWWQKFAFSDDSELERTSYLAFIFVYFFIVSVVSYSAFGTFFLIL